MIQALETRGTYTAVKTAGDGYVVSRIPVERAFVLGEEDAIADYDLVMTCVGVRNYLSIAHRLAQARIVICCENDRQAALHLRRYAQHERIYFGLADVIASNTAPEHLLRVDPLSVVSEDGVLLIERGDLELPAAFTQLSEDELSEQWACKLFLHNAPHAIAAYLGWKAGCRYMHEAMRISSVAETVTGAMEELVHGVVHAGLVNGALARAYAEKELRRFENVRLFDPVTRVARDPLRKLAPGERLLSAAQLTFDAGVAPTNVCRGIRAALEYYANCHSGTSLRVNEFLPSEILREITGIADGALSNLIVSDPEC